MRAAVLATGGKDSALALYKVLGESFEVKCLVTMIPLREDSFMFHYPNIHLAELFAKAVEIPFVRAETQGVKEKEVEDLKDVLEKLDVDAIVSGAIASTYQRTRIERICRQLGLKCITPLWKRDPLDILKELVNLKFDAIVTGVYAYGFDKQWLGRKIDDLSVENLKELNTCYGVSITGEGGEYETLVLDAPFFTKRIKVIEAEKIWKNHSGYFRITQAKLENKRELNRT